MGWCFLLFLMFFIFLISIIDTVDSSESWEYSIVTGLVMAATIYSFVGWALG